MNLAFSDRIRQKRTHVTWSRAYNVLIIDDDLDFSRSFQRVIERMGHHRAVTPSISKAVEHLHESGCDVIFLDVNLPDGNGLTHVRQFQAMKKQPEVVILTGAGNSDGAALAIANGAWDYIAAGFRQQYQASPASDPDLPGIQGNVQPAALPQTPFHHRRKPGHDGLPGRHGHSRSQQIQRHHHRRTGTGKELFARGIHENSTTNGKLVVIDCTNLPQNLALLQHTRQYLCHQAEHHNLYNNTELLKDMRNLMLFLHRQKR